MENPYKRKGCLKVDDYFKDSSQLMPLYPTSVFDNIEEMLETFEDGHRLEIVSRFLNTTGLPALRLRRDDGIPSDGRDDGEVSQDVSGER